MITKDTTIDTPVTLTVTRQELDIIQFALDYMRNNIDHANDVDIRDDGHFATWEEVTAAYDTVNNIRRS